MASTMSRLSWVWVGLFAGFAGAEEGAGEDGAGPGAEVLGGEVGVGWGDGVEVVVDVGGGDGVGVAVVVEVVEELVAGGVVAGFDDAGEAAVGEVDGVGDA